jgi:inorganic pyrophosphatase
VSDRQAFFDVAAGPNVPAIVNCIVEIPKGRRSKFEVDKKTGMIRLDRYLYSSSHYPGDYGFIPQTLAEDGDPLDILVMVNEPTFSGCLIEARVVGLFRMRDRGVNDFKILGVPNGDPLFAEYQNLRDAPSHFLREVEHFFGTYKQLEGVTIETMGWATAQDAMAEVKASIERFITKARKR